MSNGTIQVEKAIEQDVPSFMEMERDDEATRFITGNSIAEHLRAMAQANIVYLRIKVGPELAGFFILAQESDDTSVEFRRVVVANKGQGAGQAAIKAMEAYCKDVLERRRIWLDVFADNHRGRHVYAKLGYSMFREGEARGRKLLFYHKLL